MPKLDNTATVSDKREQIAYILYFSIIEDKNVYSGSTNPGGEVLNWPKDKVLEYYDKVITDEAVDAYEELVSKSSYNSKLEKVREQKYKDNYPTKESFGMDEKKSELLKMGLTEDEIAERMSEYEEELEYLQLDHENRFGKFRKLGALSNQDAISDEEREKRNEARDRFSRYSDLREKFETKKAAELIEQVKVDKENLFFINEQLNEFDGEVKEPGQVTYILNKIRRLFVDTDMKSIRKYDEYTKLDKEKKELETKISKNERKINKIKELSENVDEYVETKETNRYNLAVNIVTKITSKKSWTTHTEEEIDIMANEVMKSEEFKSLANELKVDNHPINADTFFNAYMNKLTPADANDVTNTPGNNTKQVENSKVIEDTPGNDTPSDTPKETPSDSAPKALK